MKRILLCLMMLVACISFFSACSSSGKEPKEAPSSAEITITENEDGTKTAVTKDGKEVEISAENFMDIYEEYENVSDSDSGEQKELLSEMQIILDSLSEPSSEE